MRNLLQTETIIQQLFDPQKKKYKVYVDEGRKQVYQSIPLEAKYKYLQYFLEEHWSEICGEHLAKNCAIENIQENIITIKTSSTLLANELFMMKKLLLSKINKKLAGSFTAKDLKFHTGNIVRKKELYHPLEQEEQPRKIVICPQCGAKMLAGGVVCSVCDRQNREKLSSSIMELLKIQPWLTYEECQKYYSCERYLFNDVKEILQNYYFEKVRKGYETDLEAYIAVMLLTGKSAEELNDNICRNALEFLRRNQDVPASRLGLHDKE